MSGALLLGFSAGMSLTAATAHDLDAHFKIGSGLDLLFETGAVAALRLESNHEADLLATLGGGWFAPGLRENAGLPLGISLAVAAARDHEGGAAAGGRVSLAYGLYFARAMLELDATVLQPVGRIAREDGPFLSIGLALRFVPWSPFQL